MQSTTIPKGICLEMEKLICNFVWGYATKKKAVSLVKWDSIFGLVLRNMEKQNKAFIMKVAFNLVYKDQLWVKVLRSKYKWEGCLPITLYKGACLNLWRGIQGILDHVRMSIIWNVNIGCNIDFLEIIGFKIVVY